MIRVGLVPTAAQVQPVLARKHHGCRCFGPARLSSVLVRATDSSTQLIPHQRDCEDRGLLRSGIRRERFARGNLRFKRQEFQRALNQDFVALGQRRIFDGSFDFRPVRSPPLRGLPVAGESLLVCVN